MNYKMIRFLLGRMLAVEALLLLPPLSVCFIYRESLTNVFSFLFTIALLLLVMLILGIKVPKDGDYFIEEGFVVTSLGWILMSIFGALPFVLSGNVYSFVDAFFETASGFTTTGASALTNVEELSYSMLFWRSFTHLVGGMGVLVFMLAILPTSSESVHIMKAEVPGPAFGKLLSRVGKTARVLYAIYIAMAFLTVAALIMAGMPVFDSFIHGFGAAGTGGFSMKALSIGYYDSGLIDTVLAVAMILFGINFNLHYLILIGQFRGFFKNEELRWYVSIILLSVLLISINLYSSYQDPLKLLQDVFFTVSSIVTTTGYSTANFDTWPLFSKLILLLLMFCGGMSGSTAGGLKISRVAIYIKTVFLEIKKALNPKRVLHTTFDNKPVSRDSLRNVVFYLLLYISVFVSTVVIISIDLNDMESAFSAVAASINNIGPGLGAVGPLASYAGLSDFSKILLSIVMIGGRLEILPMIILFAPSTWLNRSRVKR